MSLFDPPKSEGPLIKEIATLKTKLAQAEARAIAAEQAVKSLMRDNTKLRGGPINEPPEDPENIEAKLGLAEKTIAELRERVSRAMLVLYGKS